MKLSSNSPQLNAQYHHSIPRPALSIEPSCNASRLNPHKVQRNQIRNSIIKYIKQEERSNQAASSVSAATRGAQTFFSEFSPTLALIQDRSDRRGGGRYNFGRLMKDNKVTEYALYFREKYKQKQQVKPPLSKQESLCAENTDVKMSPAFSESATDEQHVQEFINYREKLISQMHTQSPPGGIVIKQTNREAAEGASELQPESEMANRLLDGQRGTLKLSSQHYRELSTLKKQRPDMTSEDDDSPEQGIKDSETNPQYLSFDNIENTKEIKLDGEVQIFHDRQVDDELGKIFKIEKSQFIKSAQQSSSPANELEDQPPPKQAYKAKKFSNIIEVSKQANHPKPSMRHSHQFKSDQNISFQLSKQLSSQEEEGFNEQVPITTKNPNSNHWNASDEDVTPLMANKATKNFSINNETKTIYQERGETAIGTKTTDKRVDPQVRIASSKDGYVGIISKRHKQFIQPADPQQARPVMTPSPSNTGPQVVGKSLDWRKKNIGEDPTPTPFSAQNKISSFYSMRNQNMKKRAVKKKGNPLLGLNKDILNVTSFSFEQEQDNLKKLLSSISQSRKQSQSKPPPEPTVRSNTEEDSSSQFPNCQTHASNRMEPVQPQQQKRDSSFSRSNQQQNVLRSTLHLGKIIPPNEEAIPPSAKIKSQEVVVSPKANVNTVKLEEHVGRRQINTNKREQANEADINFRNFRSRQEARQSIETQANLASFDLQQGIAPSQSELPQQDFATIPQNHFNYTIMYGEDKKGERVLWSPAGTRYSSKANKRALKQREISPDAILGQPERDSLKLEGKQIQKPRFTQPFLMHRRMIKSQEQQRRPRIPNSDFSMHHQPDGEVVFQASKDNYNTLTNSNSGGPASNDDPLLESYNIGSPYLGKESYRVQNSPAPTKSKTAEGRARPKLADREMPSSQGTMKSQFQRARLQRKRLQKPLTKQFMMNKFYQETQLSKSIVPGSQQSINKFWSKKAMSPQAHCLPQLIQEFESQAKQLEQHMVSTRMSRSDKFSRFSKSRQTATNKRSNLQFNVKQVHFNQTIEHFEDQRKRASHKSTHRTVVPLHNQTKKTIVIPNEVSPDSSPEGHEFQIQKLDFDKPAILTDKDPEEKTELAKNKSARASPSMASSMSPSSPTGLSNINKVMDLDKATSGGGKAQSTMTHNSVHVPSNKNVKVLVQKQNPKKLRAPTKADTNMELLKSSEVSNDTKRGSDKPKSSNQLAAKTLSLSRMEKKTGFEETKELKFERDHMDTTENSKVNRSKFEEFILTSTPKTELFKNSLAQPSQRGGDQVNEFHIVIQEKDPVPVTGVIKGSQQITDLDEVIEKKDKVISLEELPQKKVVSIISTDHSVKQRTKVLQKMKQQRKRRFVGESPLDNSSSPSNLIESELPSPPLGLVGHKIQKQQLPQPPTSSDIPQTSAGLASADKDRTIQSVQRDVETQQNTSDKSVDFGGTISRNHKHEDDMVTDIIDEIAELINPHEQIAKLKHPPVRQVASTKRKVEKPRAATSETRQVQQQEGSKDTPASSDPPTNPHRGKKASMSMVANTECVSIPLSGEVSRHAIEAPQKGVGRDSVKIQYVSRLPSHFKHDIKAHHPSLGNSTLKDSIMIDDQVVTSPNKSILNTLSDQSGSMQKNSGIYAKLLGHSTLKPMEEPTHSIVLTVAHKGPDKKESTRIVRRHKKSKNQSLIEKMQCGSIQKPLDKQKSGALEDSLICQQVKVAHMKKIVEQVSAESELPISPKSIGANNLSNESRTRKKPELFSLSDEVQRPNTQGTLARPRLKLNDIINGSPRSKVSSPKETFNLKVALPTKETVSILKPKKRETAQMNFSQIEAASMRIDSGNHLHPEDKDLHSQFNTTQTHLLPGPIREPRAERLLSIQHLQKSENAPVPSAKVTVKLNSQLTSFKSSPRDLDMFSHPLSKDSESPTKQPPISNLDLNMSGPASEQLSEMKKDKPEDPLSNSRDTTPFNLHSIEHRTLDQGESDQKEGCPTQKRVVFSEENVNSQEYNILILEEGNNYVPEGERTTLAIQGQAQNQNLQVAMSKSTRARMLKEFARIAGINSAEFKQGEAELFGKIRNQQHLHCFRSLNHHTAFRHGYSVDPTSLETLDLKGAGSSVQHGYPKIITSVERRNSKKLEGFHGLTGQQMRINSVQRKEKKRGNDLEGFVAPASPIMVHDGVRTFEISKNSTPAQPPPSKPVIRGIRITEGSMQKRGLVVRNSQEENEVTPCFSNQLLLPQHSSTCESPMTVLGRNSPIRVSTGIARIRNDSIAARIPLAAHPFKATGDKLRPNIESAPLKHIQQKEFKLLINRMEDSLR